MKKFAVLTIVILLTTTPSQGANVNLSEILEAAKAKELLSVTQLNHRTHKELRNNNYSVDKNSIYLREIDSDKIIKNQIMVKITKSANQDQILAAISEYDKLLLDGISINQLASNEDTGTKNKARLKQSLATELDQRKKLLLSKKIEIMDKGSKALLEVGLDRVYQISFQTDLEISKLRDLIYFLNFKDFIEYAEPNYLLKLSAATVSDPGYTLGLQWGLNTIEAEKAWEISTGDGILVSVVDDGVDYSHPDLKNQVPYGYDFEDNDNTPVPNTTSDIHGTHIAGIIAAEANNTGVVGVAFDSKLMAIKQNLTLDQLIKALIASTNWGASVINCSWGSKFYSSSLEDAFTYAMNSGALAVVAAGNDSSDSSSYYPSSFGNVLSVAATDSSDRRSDFSNYGSVVDVAAPGSGILSTIPMPEAFGIIDGTSMAAPFVAGVAALIFSYNPLFTNNDVYSVIVSSADQINTDLPIGSGRLNAYSAMIYSMVFKAYNAVDINRDNVISSYEESDFFWVTRQGQYDFKYDIDANSVVDSDDLDYIVRVIYSGIASDDIHYIEVPINKALSAVDTNKDGALTIEEIGIFKSGFKRAIKQYNPLYDIDSSGKVNNQDKKVIISIFKTLGYGRYFK